MVTVIINRDEDGRVLSFKAEGHAEAGEYGSDIVCAAISAIMQTAIQGMEGYMGLEGELDYMVNDDGWLSCDIPDDLKELEKTKAEAIIETMIIGLKSIEEQYSDNIRVEEVE